MGNLITFNTNFLSLFNFNRLKILFSYSFIIFVLEVIFLTLEIPYSAHTLRTYDSVHTSMYFMFTMIHYLVIFLYGFVMLLINEKISSSIFILLFTSAYYFMFTCFILSTAAKLKQSDEKAKEQRSVILTFICFNVVFSFFFLSIFIYLYFRYFKFRYSLTPNNIFHII